MNARKGIGDERENTVEGCLNLIETSLQRVPYDPQWIADEGEPAMVALSKLREQEFAAPGAVEAIDSGVHAPARYRKKPVEIDALRLVAGLDVELFAEFMGDAEYQFDEYGIDIHTLEGTMHALHGDWIIKGVAGEFYPCKHHIFEQTYEMVANV